MFYNPLLTLFFPKVCCCCGSFLNAKLEHICIGCRTSLPKTNYHLYRENPLQKIFWGRLALENVYSYYKFMDSGKIQRLIHQFKYKGMKEIGITVGKMYGKELMDAGALNGIDCIVPVPIHKKKEKMRGYNQSHFFAEGISISTGIESKKDAVEKYRHTSSQTRKSRYSRWKNVETSFQLKEKNELENKHILLVDDVLTTGATIEACGQKLLGVPGVKITVATMACTI